MRARTTDDRRREPENYAVLTDPAGRWQPRHPLGRHVALSAIANMVVAARANGLRPIDGPFRRFLRIPEGYKAAAYRAAVLGCEGKWAIHPSQIALANEVMSPSEAEVDQGQPHPRKPWPRPKPPGRGRCRWMVA